MVLAVGAFIGLIAINAIAPINQTAQTYTNVDGTTTTNIVKTCQSTPAIPGNNLCLISNNVQNNATIKTNSTCSNGGVSSNGECPLSVTPVSTTCPNGEIPNPSNLSACIAVITTTPQNNVTSPPIQTTIQIVPVVHIIDNNNIVTSPNLSGINFGLAPISSFIGLHGSNTPIDHGMIQMQLFVKSIPNDNVTVNGIMWVSVNSNQLHPAGIQFAAHGITDTSGNFPINLQLPSGVSPVYNLTISNYASVINQPTNILNFSVSNVVIKNGHNQLYTVNSQPTLYSTQIDYDPNEVIQQSSTTGGYVVILPSDDTFSIVSASRSYSIYYQNCSPRGGCSPYTSYITTAPPGIGSASVYQEKCSSGTECLISSVAGFTSGTSGGGLGSAGVPTGCTSSCTTSSGGGTHTISSIPRDADIRILVNSPNPYTVTLHTGLTQHNYQWACTDQGCTAS